jgi:hypothetical protein
MIIRSRRDASVAVILTAFIIASAGAVGNEPSSSTTSTLPTPSPNLQISTDGTCGNGITCAGSHWGQCCSEHGYCGNTDAYCGAGCQAAYGSYRLSPTAPSPTSIVEITKTVTTNTTAVQAQTSTVVMTSTSKLEITTTRRCSRLGQSLLLQQLQQRQQRQSRLPVSAS